MNSIGIINKFIEKLGQNYIELDRSNISKYEREFGKISDEELQSECFKALRNEDSDLAMVPESIIYRVFSSITHLFERTDPNTLQRIALATNAFSRMPADLPEGSRLYPKQVKAAISLTHKCLIQMDTGEGKTYALLPAAFALACSNQHVYIICANEYLAWRDANRTRSFWNFVGLDPALCIGKSSDDWSKRIIYTTLAPLIHQYLRSTISMVKPQNPIIFGAVLIDEADAVLLDQASKTFSVVQDIDSEIYDWSFAINYSKKLVEEEDIAVDRHGLYATLTIKGEEDLRRVLSEPEYKNLNYLLIRKAVELAYVGTVVVEENIDYIVENNSFFSVDRSSGKIERAIIPDWIIPLEFKMKAPSRPETITLDVVSTRIFLNKFTHLSGMSGTISDDSIEYLLSYLLPTITIPPRKKRFDGHKTDLIYHNKTIAVKVLCDKVLEFFRQNRPVLIGTQTISDAEEIYKQLLPQMESPEKLKLLTGKTELESARIFETGGEIGSVVVATQLAGRGVDIRLSPEAKTNGGLVLICLAHSETIRHDKQFLGRAGRQGEPFTSFFVCALDDSFSQRIISKSVQNMMLHLGMEGEKAIESPVVARQMKNAQIAMRRNEFYKNRQYALADLAYEEIRKSIENWFEYLQIPADAEQLTNYSHLTADDIFSEDFINHLIDHFIKNNLKQFVSGKNIITVREAKQITEILNFALRLVNPSQKFLQENFEDIYPSDAENLIKSRVKYHVVKTVKNYENLRNDCLENFWSAFRSYDETQKSEESEISFETEKAEVDLENQEKEIVKETASDTSYENILDKNTPRDDTQNEYIENITDEPGDDENKPGSIENLSVVSSDSSTNGDQNISTNVYNEYSQSVWNEYQRYSKRSPLNIAYWNLLTVWMEFLQERERVVARTYQKNLTSLESSRMITDQLTDEWKKLEGKISTNVLSSLFNADTPQLLDQLFVYEDYRLFSQNESESNAYNWETLDQNENQIFDPTENIRNLIKQFVREHEDELDEGNESQDFNESKLRALLRDFFINKFPLHTLQTPNQIQEALASRHKEDLDRSVPTKIRKLNKEYLRDFLIFLRNRHLIGPMPNIQHRFQNIFTNFTKTISETRTAARLLGLLMFFIIFILAIKFGNILPVNHFGDSITIIDTVLFGSLISSGNIVAPTFGAILLGIIIQKVIFPQNSVLQGQGLNGHLTLLIQLLMCVWLIDWSVINADFLGIFKSFGFFLLMFGLARLASNTSQVLEIDANLFLPQWWLTYTLLCIFPQTIIGSFSSNTLIYLCFFGLPILILIWQKINFKEIEIVSTRIQGSSTTMKYEEISTALTVNSECGFIPHIISFVLVWSIFDFLRLFPSINLNDFKFEIVLSLTLIYLITDLLFIIVKMTKRFDFLHWKKYLNNNRQEIKDVDDDEKLQKKLLNFRNQLLLKEFFFQTFTVLAITYLTYDFTFRQTNFPFSLIIIPMAWLFYYSGKTFIEQSYRFLFSRVYFSVEVMDFSESFEVEEKEQNYIIKFIRKYFTKTVITTILIFQALKILVDFYDIVDAIQRAFDYFSKMFK